MPPRLNNNWCVVFDLDDTLCQEIDFLTSAFQEIAETVGSRTSSPAPSSAQIGQQMLEWYHQKENVFARLLEWCPDTGMQVPELIERYRAHHPQLSLNPGARELLDWLDEREIPLGLITDGYSQTQRNKLQALGIIERFDLLVISEEFGSQKPDRRNFEVFEQRFPERYFVYLGDNLRKDFVTPNQLGWTTIALRDRGQNIHSQRIDSEEQFLPRYFISSLAECCIILDDLAPSVSCSPHHTFKTGGLTP